MRLNGNNIKLAYIIMTSSESRHHGIEPMYIYTARAFLMGKEGEVVVHATSARKLAKAMNISETSVRRLLDNKGVRLPFITYIKITREPIGN